ncbi:putative drug/metabolite transporter (DMT) superfamily protein [Listeria weihenstephanensis FSL R9-0317]|uniref:DMT family transporter n=1 Tax=Listeria weihenstephanensis TaxID=1006155 RepID=A0A1S7FXX0_9LIST|nr:DMT family transporter [Listeria weihenstephanensis]AQY52250.1 membrane protein [Listeria weihenstephanensis]EUJ35361.1 putative drug/metabolite transporter (DMT) superfamily protein [Listeria weihenstephanensis FSL R9-0317]MBC1500222.1 DMT family transporter [Listeria weihenstephanensis]
MQKGKTQTSLYLLLVLVMASWGLNVTATKVLVAHFPPITMTSFRIFTAAIAVFIFLIAIRKFRFPTRRELGYIVAGSLFNIVIHHYFLASGLTMTTGTNGGLILGIGPILTAILAVIFLHEAISRAQLIGLVSGLLGVSLIVLTGGQGLSGISLGDIYVFIAILSQCFSFIIIKRIAGSLDPRLMTAYMLLIGSVLLFFTSLIQEPDGLAQMSGQTTSMWLLFLASALFATAFGNLIYNFAVGQIGPSKTAIFMNLNPFFSLIGAALFLNEQISMMQILGFILIIIGVMLGSGALPELLRARKKVRDPEKIMDE